MATTVAIPLTTLTPNQVINVPPSSVSGFSNATLSLDRNVGAASLDTSTTATLTLQLDYSKDGGSTWAFLMSATVPGGVIWANKAQTVRQETSLIQVGFFAGTTHVRGSVTNGSVQVSVSGSLTLS